MKIDLDTACKWLLDNAIYSQNSVTDEFDEEDLAKRFREAMEKENDMRGTFHQCANRRQVHL